MENIYLLDTNFFIQAHRMSYPLDIFKGFWYKIKELADSGEIISIDKVKNEIFKNEDDLKAWCKENLNEEFWKDSGNAINEYAKIAEWAVNQNERYQQPAIHDFLNADNADAFLVAYALAEKEKRIIVSYEKPSNKKSIIKIPDVCEAFDINFVEPLIMFRELKITL